MAALLRRLPDADLPAGAVRVASAPFAGEFAVVATTADGTSVRLDGRSLAERPLSADAWLSLPAFVAGDTPILEAGWLHEDDAYYFSHHDEVEFPVYRLILDDADRTRLYFDALSGRLAKKVDAGARGFRWWFQALHRGDFLRLSRQRPLWDIVMLALLAGVTIGAVTGVYIGFRRLTR